MQGKGFNSFIATATAILGLFAFWDKGVGAAATWFIDTSALILLRPQVQAVLTSIAVGVLLAGFLPHVPLPWVQRLQPSTTKALTRLVCVLVTFSTCMALSDPQNPFETRSALVYATLAALSASAAWTTLAGLIYRFQHIRPESLK